MPESTIFDDVAAEDQQSGGTTIFDDVAADQPAPPQPVAALPRGSSVWTRAQDYLRSVPGAVEEAAKGAWENRPRLSDVPGMAAGAVNVISGPGPTPGATPEIGTEYLEGGRDAQTPGKRLGGVAKIVDATGQLVSPIMGPAALENPIPMAVGLGTGMAGGKGARAVTKAAGGGPQAQDLAEAAGFWLPSIAGAVIRPKVGVGVTPDEVLVGAGVNPPVVGPRAVGIRIPRGPRPSPGPANGLEPPTIDAVPPTQSEIADAMEQTNYAGPDATREQVMKNRAAAVAAQQPAQPAAPEKGTTNASPAETQPSVQRSAAPKPRAPKPAPQTIEAASGKTIFDEVAEASNGRGTTIPETTSPVSGEGISGTGNTGTEDHQGESQAQKEVVGTVKVPTQDEYLARRYSGPQFEKWKSKYGEEGAKMRADAEAELDAEVGVKSGNGNNEGQAPARTSTDQGANGIESSAAAAGESNTGTRGLSGGERLVHQPEGTPENVGQPASEEVTPTYKHRSTQANIPDDSEAGQALTAARGRISDSDLAGDGKDVGENHVTVRYGLKADSDVEGVKKYLSSLEPFEARLGITSVFPPSESSDGAAVVHAPIISPELNKINAEIEKHGEFAPSNFPDYKPHATIAYVKPEAAQRYKGMGLTSNKKFPVNEIAITDRNGQQEMVKLGGRSEGSTIFDEIDEAAKAAETAAMKKRIAELEKKVAPKSPAPPRQQFEGTTYQVRGKEVAARLRSVADRMDAQIENARRPMTQNPTPKRMAEYRSRVIDADEMERTQKAMRALADAHEAGTISMDLAGLRSKDEIGRLVHKGLDSSKGGYYDRVPRSDYHDKSPAGKKLQEMIEGVKSPEATAAKLAKEKASKISQLEADVQFRPLPGYFPTPKAVVAKMLDAADIKSGMSVLEPSAGKGNIADAIKEQSPDAKLSVVEQASKLQEILKLKDHNLVDSDFLEHDNHYDRIVMNPPFEKGADVDHVRHAFELLKPGGRLVAIMSPHAEFASDKKSVAFREWVDSLGGESEKLPDSSFKESGTGVASRMVVIDKPAEFKWPAAEQARPEVKKSDWNVGDIATFSKIPPGSYLSANEPFRVESVSKKGQVQFRNVRTGGGTSEHVSMLKLAEYTKETAPSAPRRDVIPTEKKAAETGKQIAGADGSETKLLTNDGEQPAKYRVVEARDLIPSHNAQTFAKNPGYPAGVQERAYDTSKEAQNRVIQQSQHFNPDYLINSNPDAVNGPPVITPDGTVLGGNSRTMTVQRVYQNKNFVAYKHVLIREAEKFGLDKEAVRKMDEPVLVREVATPKTQDEMRAIGTALNKSMTGALGVSERAVSAGKAISRDTLSSISAMLDGIGKDASLRDLMRERGKDVLAALVKDGAITERERPQFVDTATGGLSEEGKTFVERALLGSVVDDPRLMDSTPKSILNKLDGSLAALSSVAPRTDAYNILPLVREALREHGEIAQRGTNVEDYLSQTGLFSSERDPAVDAITRVLAGKSTTVRERFRRFAEDANFDVQGQATLGLIEQPSPAKAFNEAFGSDLSDEDLETSILKAVQSEPTIQGNGGEAQAVRPTEAGAGSVQRGEAGEPRPSGEGGAGSPEKAEPETKLGSLFSGESGTFAPSALKPSTVKRFYRDWINKVIDENLDLGEKYQRVKEHDPEIAALLHDKDHAPRYYHDKAESNVNQVTKGLNEEQIRLTAMLSDSDAREYLQEHYPDQYEQAREDPEVMAGVQRFKQFQDEIAALRMSLGWHVRRDLTVFENEPDEKGDVEWSVLDRDGNEVEDDDGNPARYTSYRDANSFVEQNGTILDHLKRTYPEHLREPLMGRVDEGPGLGATYGGIKPPRPDKKQRLATAEYFYQHGAKDFSGYVKSYTQVRHAALNQKIFDTLTENAEKYKEGTAMPPQIEYRGETYYSPTVAQSMKLAKPENRPKVINEYRAYDPAKDDKALIKDFENGWSTRTTGRPGISPSDRWLAPKEVVQALEQYDMTRGQQEGDSIRRFFQEQIVGLFGPTVHVLNIMRRLAHTVGSGAWDPRVWPYYQKLFFSKELRERMAEGLNDDAIDALSKNGTYTNARDIGSLHAYVLGNMNPANWVRQTIGKFSKGVLFDPKFMGGFGGLDQKARVLAYDYLHDSQGWSEKEASKNVEDGFGNYNKANWTERMKRWARLLLFPGWDFSSLKWFLQHPIRTAFLPALATLGANLAINLAGKNKDQDKYDYGYLHYGDRKFRTSLVTESMALHLATPLLEAGKAALEGGDVRDVASATGQGAIRGAGGFAGALRPDAQMAADLITNRQYLGGEKEIWKPEDANMPGKVLPTRQLDKMATFAIVKAFPAINRFLDSSYENVDVATGAGSVMGVTNYRDGAEQRLRVNAAKAKGYSQTLSELSVADPKAAVSFVQEPDKAMYLMFNKDFAELEGDLKNIDKSSEEIKLAPIIARRDRDEALKNLESARKQILNSADAIADAMTSVRLGKKKAK